MRFLAAGGEVRPYRRGAAAACQSERGEDALLMAYRLGKLLFFCGLLLLLTALWKKVELPAPQALRTDLLAEPRQVAVQKAPFHVSVGKIDYLVQPLFKYDLYGMVVSRHDSDTWWDYIHKDWNDRLNVACLLYTSPSPRDGLLSRMPSSA